MGYPEDIIGMFGNLKVIEKCAKNFNGYSRLAFNNHKLNIDC